MMRYLSSFLAVPFLVVLALGWAGPLRAAPMVTGQINDGDTFGSNNAFNFTNTSTAGESITSLTFTIPGAFFFDTTNLAPGAAPSGPDISSNPGGATISVADGTSTLSVTFTDFGPGELFSFGVDTDDFANPDSTVVGAQLVGSMATFTFSNGSMLEGSFVDDGVAGNGIAAVLEIEPQVEPAPVPEPASLAVWALLGVAGAGYRLRRGRQGRPSA